MVMLSLAERQSSAQWAFLFQSCRDETSASALRGSGGGNSPTEGLATSYLFFCPYGGNNCILMSYWGYWLLIKRKGSCNTMLRDLTHVCNNFCFWLATHITMQEPNVFHMIWA